jgi:manganese/zinc/iron transport system ATP- binding protein
MNQAPVPLPLPALALRGVSVAYGHDPVLWNVTWNSPASGLVAVVGPNGAGKSTLLKAALGLVPRLAGEVRFFGAPLSAVRRRVGFLPQRAAVDWDFPATALDVAAMGRYPRRSASPMSPTGRSANSPAGSSSASCSPAPSRRSRTCS